MKIRIESELGRLRTVLVHRPGLEIDRMSPSMMERLLFDDILYGASARREHSLFETVLERSGARVVIAGDLLGEALAADGAVDWVLGELTRREGLRPELRERLAGQAPAELARTLVEGLPNPATADGRNFFLVNPVPNYFFQRDPQVLLGRQVLTSSMATGARAREALLGQTIFTFHPELSAAHDGRLTLDSSAGTLPTVEGGDVLVPSPEVILIGVSERTNRWGVQALAKALQGQETSFRHLLVVDLPQRRSYMHLDTVFTFVDRDLCLGYPPVIGAGSPETGHVYRVDLDAPNLSFTVQPSLTQALSAVGLDIEVVPCGGAERLNQEREQWTDGANAFALEPGVILLYHRNQHTVDELDRRGWRVLTEEQVVSGEEPMGQGPTVITLEGDELSRARGGPRCMTAALEREELS
ncbi:MAG: arginine deiminase family protein [Acidobacteriota bacterium]